MVIVPILLVAGCSDEPGNGSGAAGKNPAGGSDAAVGQDRSADSGADLRTDGEVHFRFAFFAGDGEQAITDRAVLASGTRVQMQLEFLTDPPNVGYVIHRDPNGGLSALLPRDSLTARGGICDVLPPGTTLDQVVGIERFHVIVAPAPLAELDAALDSGDTEALRAALQQVRGAYEVLEAVAGKPASIGGTLRGVGDLATEFEQRGVFCRTYTIDHR